MNLIKTSPRQFFMILWINGDTLLQYLSYKDHKNLSIAYPDLYMSFLLNRVNYRKNTNNYDSIVKMVLESIKIQSLKPRTLNLFHRGFWNHISLNCRLQEKFIYKWSHKINMFRLKVNKHCRTLGGKFGWELQPRQFSETFKSRFPGIETYKPCYICFQDTDNHHNYFNVNNDWVCEDCMDDDSYDDDSWSDDYLPSDRHWSEDDSDYFDRD